MAQLPPLTHAQVFTGTVSLHVVTAGPDDAPPVLLLHGFPECWWSWSRQIGPLVDAGFRVIVPDQRGYGQSDKPPRTRDYAMGHLVADIVGLLDALELDRVHLVGHDWGGAVSWTLALTHPERIRSFVPMNMPHLGVFLREVRRWRQLKRSWYIGAFQVPWLPERLLLRDDCQPLVSALFGNTVHKPFTDHDLAVYRRAWTQPGAVRGMLSWYRASVRHPAAPPPHDTYAGPALMIWGRRDEALGFPMVEPSAAKLLRGRLEVIDDAGHFVQHDRPDRVNELLLGFLREVGPTTD